MFTQTVNLVKHEPAISNGLTVNFCIVAVFQLEKTFKTTFALLVLHMWLFLRRMKVEGKEGVEFGQYLYEIYNHDLELRVSKAGVSDHINCFFYFEAIDCLVIISFNQLDYVISV